MLGRAQRFALGVAAAAVDRAVTGATALAARGGKARPAGAEALGHDDRLGYLDAAAAEYAGLFDVCFRPPRRIRPTVSPLGPAGAADAPLDLAWESDFQPLLPALEAKWTSPENAVAHARLWPGAGARGGALRPAIVLVHGYLGGHPQVEAKVFPVERLRSLGLDVVLFTLPFHGRRAEPRRRFPRFPGHDPRVTVEGLRQAVGDLRDLVGHLLERGHPSVGLMGMSLGGYTSALTATLEDRLAHVTLLIPLASFADWARDHGRLTPGYRESAAEHAAAERAYWVASPFARPPQIEGRAVLVLAAEHDRITPPAQARRLAEHFGAPFHTFPGSHLLHVGRDRHLTHLASMLRDRGVLPR